MVGVEAGAEALDEGEVDAEDVGDVRVGLGERDQHLEELAQGGAATTVLGGDADRAESRLADEVDRGERGLERALRSAAPSATCSSSRARAGVPGRGCSRSAVVAIVRDGISGVS